MMKKIISSICVVVFMLSSFPQDTSIANAEPLPPISLNREYTRSELELWVEHYANEYGVSSDTMKQVITCESGWNTDIQSRHTRPDGSQEQSFGLVQIFLPAHPYISYEQAVDPIFSIEFMAKSFAEGNATWWTCYNHD
jgi:hypothetical protein